MRGLLLSLGDIIADAFGWVLKSILKPLIELALEFILLPILELLMEVISYAVGAVLYVISTFLLQLIDFVEVLFRALAGMESVSASGMSLSLSLDGGSGDILIQLIRHPDIQAAFVSMCVVGLFLLVVTTVFQIIKVEYTTEGAKNAKGPIFQKAFKGFANLMLLPLLVIFGIIFANQLLGLLDTATKGTGDNPTISGLIFVAAASEAHYLEGEEQLDIEADNWLGIALDGIIYSVEVLLEGLGEAISGEEEKQPAGFANAGSIDSIENNFISQKEGFRYYNIGEVSDYYNYAFINYFLLLFSAVFALKALFFSCFGMVIRLYKCAVLFIISPAIIGMTPINEGGLGKWRTAFIGQVLSAYGTVLSLNMFFIIVRVLLSIEVNFTSPTIAANGINMLTSTLMTLLLKCVFVLAGCLLIEKFSKELGGYFGAEDAMGAGKQMAGEVGDLAMKGIGAAAMVATGGAGLAMKGIKAAGGIAGKIGKSGVGKFAKGVAGKAGKAISESPIGDAGRWVSGKAKAVSSGVNKASHWVTHNKVATWLRGDNADTTKSHFNLASETKDGLVAKREAAQEKIKKAQGTVDEKKARIAQIEEVLTDPKRTISESGQKKLMAEREHLVKQVEIGERSIGASKKIIDGYDAGIAAQDKEMAPYLEKETERKGTSGRKKLAAISTLYGLGMKGRDSLPGHKYFKQFGDATKSGAKALGDPFEAAAGSVDYMKGKKVQDLWQGGPGMQRLIAAQNALGSQEVMKQAAKEMSSSIDSMARNVESIMRDLAETIGSYKDPNMRQQRMDSVYDHIRRSGAAMDRSTFDSMIAAGEGKSGKALAEAISIDAKQHLNINFDAKSITDALNRAMSKGALTPEALRKELQGLFTNMGKDGEAALLKIIQDAIAKVGGQIGGK